MEEKDRRLLRLVGSLSTVGIAMVASTVIGYFIGKYLDGLFGLHPWLTILFLLLGIASGFKNLFDQAKKVQNLDRPEEKGKHDE